MTKPPTRPAKPWTEEEVKEFDAIRAKITEAFRPWVQGYYELKDGLEAEGFRILVEPDDEWPTMAPVQLQGQLPSGEQFYFRGRGKWCSLHIAPADGDPIMAPTWETEDSRWQWPDAGALSAEEAKVVLREFLAEYAKDKPNEL